MIKDNKSKVFSMSGFSFITKIHDDNFATITMNGILKIFLGKKPFNCLKQKQITKTTELYNIKEIIIQKDSLNKSKEKNDNNTNVINHKVYLLLYAKDILIYSFENNYQKSFLIQKIDNKNYIGALIQLENRNIIFLDKLNKINLMIYIQENKKFFHNEITQPKINNKINNTFILSFIELDKNIVLTTSTTKHPLGEDIIRIYRLENNGKNSSLKIIKNFNGFSSAIFENNVIKLESKKTICIAINYYIKNNIILENNCILLLNYEFLEITTILQINCCVNSIFNFSLILEGNDFKRSYDYIMISQFKGNNNKINKKSVDNYRFIDFYVFEPKYEYEPLLIEEERIITKSSIDITNSFIINKNYLVIFQTDQINIYLLKTK